MSIIGATAYARAGLLGNPSDGYQGKIIAVSLKNYSACVELRPSKRLCIEHWDRPMNEYGSLEQMVGRVKLHGYYEGDRLIKAIMKQFWEYCHESGRRLREDNFTLRYKSDIPRQIGLAGSSAIITATLRVLMAHYDVDIPMTVQPNLILAAELDELGINAGLMDRVIQVYEGCVYMDFSPEIMGSQGYGNYESIDVNLLPELYIAYDPSLGKVSGHVLNDIRKRYDEGDVFVIGVLDQLADLAEQGREALLRGNTKRFSDCMDKNFELRARIMHITEGNRRLVETARACGASAKFTGSGGSIIGVYESDEQFDHLKEALEGIGAIVIRPMV